jgi:hypothetical protein
MNSNVTQLNNLKAELLDTINWAAGNQNRNRQISGWINIVEDAISEIKHLEQLTMPLHTRELLIND